MFVIFALTWILTRHVIFGRIMWSIYEDTFRLITSGWNPDMGSYFSPTVIYSYLAFFVVLQGLMLYWSYFIFRVVCSFKSSNDPRSDSEDEEEKHKKND
jgi:very-long-chain ceramide synthase